MLTRDSVGGPHILPQGRHLGSSSHTSSPFPTRSTESWHLHASTSTQMDALLSLPSTRLATAACCSPTSPTAAIHPLVFHSAFSFTSAHPWAGIGSIPTQGWAHSALLISWHRRGNHPCSDPRQRPGKVIIKYQQPPEATRGCACPSALSWLQQEMPNSFFSTSSLRYSTSSYFLVDIRTQGLL